MIKKADILLALALIILGIAGSYALAAGEAPGEKVVISVDGKEYGTYSLMENREITIRHDHHVNRVAIKDGRVSMASSDCAGDDCVRRGFISQTSQTIVCLPNKVLIEIQADEPQYDGVT